MIAKPIQQQFSKNGFVKLPHFFEPKDLHIVKQMVEIFHHVWCADTARDGRLFAFFC
jgi:hypothetical protein